MASIKRGFNYLLHNRWQFVDSIVKNFLQWLPDKLYLSIRYRAQMGKWIDWKNPKTFNEKINWLKIYNRKPEYTMLVDKYEVKKYVANKIGPEYIIPTIGIWDRPQDIEWEKLPNQFVLKSTHGGGSLGVIICKDKLNFDTAEATRKLNGSLKSDLYKDNREWPYKNVKRRIIAEKYMTSSMMVNDKELDDYKFYCFNGEPVYCQVIRDRSTEETIDFYDMGWNHQEFVGLNPKCKNGITPVEKPICFDDMVRVCKELAKDIPFVRVDLYAIDEKEYFGELTFYPSSGIGRFTPEIWEHTLGDLLTLPTTSGGGYKCLLVKDIIQVLRMDSSRDLKDYKFFCFNGKVQCFKIDVDRFHNHHANYYSPAGELLRFGETHFPPDFNHKEQLPDNLNQMIELAEKLSEGHPFLRVDLYNIQGKIYFGELTFFPAGGMGQFTEDKWDTILGEWLTIKYN